MQVAPGGHIVALDTADYGPVTIASDGGVSAIVNVASGDGITVNLLNGEAVILRGLDIKDFGTGNGITIAGGNVTVKNRIINGGSTGICANTFKTTIRDTIIAAATM